MRTLSLNYAAVGAFVLAMLTAAIAAGAMLAGGSGPSDNYHVMLDNVSDIRFGTVVRYEGYPVGEVGRIVPQPDGAGMRFRVEISVERGWRIPSDSVARIGSSNLLANKTIDITGGRSDEAVVVGAAIRGAPPSDVFAAMSSLAGELGDLNKDSLRPLIDQVGSVVGEIDALIRRDLGQITGGMAAVATTPRRKTRKSPEATPQRGLVDRLKSVPASRGIIRPPRAALVRERHPPPTLREATVLGVQ